MLEPERSRLPSLDRGRVLAPVLALLAPRRRGVQIAQVTVVILAGWLVRIAFIHSAGYRDDVVIFYAWFKSIAALPLAQVYAHTPGLNYPPTVVLMYKLEALAMGWFVHGPPSDHALDIAIKLPPILMDGAGAALTYSIIRHYASHALALLGAAFIALNPAVIYDSAYWGQNDAIPTVLALFAVSQLLFGNTIVGWLSITAALFFKPPVLVLVPLMLLHPFRVTGQRRRSLILETVAGVGVAVVFAVLLAVTFFDHPNLLVAMRHLIGQYVGFSNVFPYTSLNAFNVWALFEPFFTTDRTKFLALSLHTWSDVVFIIAAGCIYWRYVKSRDDAALLKASTLILLAFFVLLTEMHERYLYYAVFFCATLVFMKPYRTAALILSLTLLLNLEYGLTFMYLDDAKATMVDRFEFAPWLVHICAAANVGVLLWQLVTFLGGRNAGDALPLPVAEPAHATGAYSTKV